jgi:Na+/melibiose symporter-like transporter
LLTPFAAAQLIFAPRSAAMVKKYGPKVVCAVGMGLSTVALAGFALIGQSSPIWIVAVLFFIQGAGLANVIPPATESIMSTLPREKAGVGSAVSNTIRQVGGALGVAILGSVLSGVYRNQISDHVANLPAAARGTASASISGTYAVAGQLGAPGRSLIAAGNAAFISAMHWAALGSVVVGLIGLVVVLIWLPRRSMSFAAPQPAGPQPPQSPATQSGTPGGVDQVRDERTGVAQATQEQTREELKELAAQQ